MAVNAAKPMSPQDESVWFKVRVELKINPETESFAKGLKISVNRGVVTLQGDAPTQEAAKAAERVALGVRDVINVVNNLKVS